MGEASASVFGQIDAMVEKQTRSGDGEFALPASVVTHFERAGLQSDEVYEIIGSQQEIARLVRENGQLTADQTDRASRVARVVSLAERVFQKREKAFLWLRLPNPNLGQRKPIECLARESSARLVEETLLQMEYGVYA